MSEKHTPEELEHTRVMAQAMRATTPEQRRELDMLLYGSNPPLDVLLAAPELLEACEAAMLKIEAYEECVPGEVIAAEDMPEEWELCRAAIAKAKPDA